ncbi:monofunctional biosynthetic peptidoglycan transglycosylase [Bacteroides heparinolyticus]|uniref:Biosynthetic peptidoglycan transglycosylase n=3 Tax=Prevotella heparinolytica TaxID=28113 RepID=A0A4R2LMK0_9BACE|nr:monofunctional biosynthetic peptidoglycan transglycosylase [Bacteroides heparinolyticus]
MKAPTFGIPEFAWRYPCVRALYNQDNAGSSVSVSLHGGKSKVSICFMKLRKPLRILRNIILFFFISTFATAVLYRFLPVYVTPLMVIRSVQQLSKGEKPLWHHTWVSFDKISPHLPMAVIASEDNRFATHNGFDFTEIKKAMKEAEKGRRRRGASTISQQTAKNVFLWPKSSWLRKGFEVYFTCLIELCWSKERIMEVYLNSIEMGKGIYGAQAAAKYKFNTTAAKLSAGQCALIAATLPNPIRFDSARPSAYIKKRQGQILRLMKLVPKFPPAEKKEEKIKKK